MLLAQARGRPPAGPGLCAGMVPSWRGIVSRTPPLDGRGLEIGDPLLQFGHALGLASVRQIVCARSLTDAVKLPTARRK